MLKRLPAKQDIAPVFAVIVSIIYGWSIAAFLRKIPSWILFLQVDEIIIVLVYVLTVTFLGSILFMIFLLFFCILLPVQYFKNYFAAQGALASLSLIGSVAIYINRYSEYGAGFLKYGPIWLGVTIMIAVFLSYLAIRVRFLRRAILWVADRLIIFLYVFVPLSVISLSMVILRNIF